MEPYLSPDEALLFVRKYLVILFFQEYWSGYKVLMNEWAVRLPDFNLPFFSINNQETYLNLKNLRMKNRLDTVTVRYIIQ